MTNTWYWYWGIGVVNSILKVLGEVLGVLLSKVLGIGIVKGHPKVLVFMAIVKGYPKVLGIGVGFEFLVLSISALKGTLLLYNEQLYS